MIGSNTLKHFETCFDNWCTKNIKNHAAKDCWFEVEALSSIKQDAQIDLQSPKLGERQVSLTTLTSLAQKRAGSHLIQKVLHILNDHIL